jgi:hypothetical protein
MYFNVDLPIADGKYPVGEELDKLIQGFIPVWHFERQELLSAGVSNADAIRALVVEESVPDPEPLPADASAMQKRQKAIFDRVVEQQVLAALVKHEVLPEDKINIPSTTL